MTTSLTLERGVLWFEDGAEVSNVSESQLKNLPEAYRLLRYALADLEGAMPHLEPSGDRLHSGWETVKEITSLLKRIGE